MLVTEELLSQKLNPTTFVHDKVREPHVTLDKEIGCLPIKGSKSYRSAST